VVQKVEEARISRGYNFFIVQSLDAHSKGCTGVIKVTEPEEYKYTILL
jgi:hypothetical protein